MAGTQTAVFGSEDDYHFGPGDLYVNTSSGFIPAGFTGATGTGTWIGKTGPLEISFASNYAEATSIQTGTEMDDAAVSGQRCEISTTLKQAGIDRLETSVDGISVERDTDDQPVRWGYVNVVGKRKRANAFQLTFVERNAGVEQWGTPFLVLDFFETVSMSAETTATIDAENFRELAVTFRTFPDANNEDYNGREAFFLSRTLTTE